MASIQKYKTSKGETRYKVAWRDAGRQRSKSFDRHVKAKDFLTNLEHSMRSGIYISPTKKTIGNYLDEWLLIHSKKVKYNTYKAYLYDVKNIKFYIDNIPLQKLNGDHLEHLYKKLKKGEDEKKGLSNKSIHNIHQTINTALKAAVRKKYITINPCETIDIPDKGAKYQPNVIDPTQVKDYLLLFKGTWLYPGIIISTVCGLRRGELCALKWSNVNLKTGELFVEASVYVKDNVLLEKPPKSGKARKVYMPESLRKLLYEHKRKQKKFQLLLGTEYHRSDYVITYDDGCRPYPERFTRQFMRILKRSSLQYVRFHDLRGTMASLTCFEGYGDEVASAALGHHDPKFTRTYYIQQYDQQLIETAQTLDKYIADLI